MAPVTRALVLALACAALAGCRKRDLPSGPQPSASVPKTVSASSSSPKRTLTLQLLRSAHAELLAMADRHEPAPKLLEAATLILGEPHERGGGTVRWFAWNPDAQPSSPKGCWQLSAGAERNIGMTARASCGQ